MSTSTADIAEIGRAEIVDGSVSGGTNTSHTIVVPALKMLLSTVAADAPHAEYERAVVEENFLAKKADGARRRTFRYLRELYLLRPDSVLFRALRDLWPDNPEAQPMLACLCAFARDAVFRASAPAVLDAMPGQRLTSADLAAAVGERFPSNYGPSTLGKIGRNTFSSWEQSGHLEVSLHNTKARVRPPARPASLAYALLLGFLEGGRGERLFTTPWVRTLSLESGSDVDLAIEASRRGLIEFRQAGGMTDVSFQMLLRPMEHR